MSRRRFNPTDLLLFRIIVGAYIAISGVLIGYFGAAHDWRSMNESIFFLVAGIVALFVWGRR